MLRRVVIGIAVLGSAGCPSKPDPAPVGTPDARLDGAGEGDETNSQSLRMCVTSEGKIHTVWVDDREGSSAIWYNGSLDAGRSWLTAPIRLSQGEGQSTAPDVACVDDNVYVAWEDDRDGELENHNVYFARSTNGGSSWSEDAAIDMDEDGANMSLGPRLAASENSVYVAWFDSRNGAYDIYVAASEDNGEIFGEPVRADSDEAGASYSAWPRIAAQYGDVVHVAWEDSRDGNSDVYYTVSNNGGSFFDTDVRLDGGDPEGQNDSFSPRLAVADEFVAVVWHDARNGEARDIFMNVSEDAGSDWEAEAIRVDSDGEGFSESLYPEVAVANGAAHVVWQDARNTGYDIFYRKWASNEFTADEVRMDTDGAGFANSLYPKVSVGESGIAVVWQDGRDDAENEGYADLYYNWSEDGGATFEDEDLRIDYIEPGSKYVADVNSAMVQQQVLAAWVDGRNGSSDIYFHAMTLGEDSPPVQEANASE